MDGAQQEGRLIHPATEAFLASPSDSIDYAVMEGAENVVVAPVDPGWSDVGGWAALHELGEKDAAGNVVIGQVLSIDAEGNYLRVDAGTRLAVVGISGLVVVAHGNDIVIVPREDRTSPLLNSSH